MHVLLLNLEESKIRRNKLKWVKILKNENTDENQNGRLILLQPFLRLAYTTFYSKKETIFGASRKRLVFPINFFMLKEILKIFIKADLETGGKLLFVCQYIRQNRVTIE